MTDHPNVILVLADDQGSVDARCYGAQDLVTPNIDRLAAAGVRFTDFYANAAICMPSRACLLTGRHFPRALMPGVGLKPDEVTAAQLLRDAGYRTALFGKWHLGETPALGPNARGFERFVGHAVGTLDAYSHFYYWGGVNRHVLLRDGAPLRAPGTYLPDLLTGEATQFIHESRDRPFFLYLAFAIPHYPVQPRREHRERYEAMDLEDTRRVLYGAYLTTLDDCLGRVLDAVEAEDLAQRTLVIYLSDNGHSVEEAAFGGGGSAGPFRGHKQTLWEGGIRVPCLAAWPGQIPAGAVRQQPAQAIDWLPTIAAMCGVPLPADRVIDGRDLAPVLAGGGAPAPHPRLHWVHYDGTFAAREGRWKLHSGPEGHWLSDLAADPGERENRAADEPALSRHLLLAHNEWVREVTRDAPQFLHRTGPGLEAEPGAPAAAGPGQDPQ